MYMKQLMILAVVPFMSVLAACSNSQDIVTENKSLLDMKQSLGKQLFFDPRLSSPAGQSCASCHSPDHGFADPRGLPVSEGVIPGRFTPRNSPSVSYAAFSPLFHLDKAEGLYEGGLFYDGRAETLELQAEGPILSAVEMANTDKASVVDRIRDTEYLAQFKKIYGTQALADSETGFAQIVDAIAAYERSEEVNPFTSKYDYYLQGKVELTAQEMRGLKLYEAEDKGNCAACHPSQLPDDGSSPLFTDFTYDNLGVPANPKNPFLTQDKQFNPEGEKYVDLGLGGFLGDKAQNGKFKVTTIRNIEKTAPYMHNGVFETLEEVVDFYNTRDVDKKWPKPEVSENVNKDELGDLKLTEQEVKDIVVFMKTLTDGYTLSK